MKLSIAIAFGILLFYVGIAMIAIVLAVVIEITIGFSKICTMINKRIIRWYYRMRKKGDAT